MAGWWIYVTQPYVRLYPEVTVDVSQDLQCGLEFNTLFKYKSEKSLDWDENDCDKQYSATHAADIAACKNAERPHKYGKYFLRRTDVIATRLRFLEPYMLYNNGSSTFS